MKNGYRNMAAAVMISAALFCAGGAAAEVSIGVEAVGYTSAHIAWGAAPASSARLSEAAAKLSAAAASGDAAGAQAQLAKLFSGSAGKGEAAPVYFAAAPAAPAPVKAPAPAAARRAPALPVEEAAAVTKSADGEDKPDTAAIYAAALAQGSADIMADQAAEGREDAVEEEKPAPALWLEVLAYAIGIMLVVLIICLL